jgi:hypothetical protein
VALGDSIAVAEQFCHEGSRHLGERLPSAELRAPCKRRRPGGAEERLIHLMQYAVINLT